MMKAFALERFLSRIPLVLSSVDVGKVFRFFTSIRLTVFCLLWLAVLTFFGTLYQVDHGIYEAQERFFDSLVFVWGVIPVPGGMLTMGLLFLNLCASFFVHYSAGWRMPGLMLIHLGLILLLLGGFFTRVTGIEANVSLYEGEGTNTASSVTEWEVAMTKDPPPVREWRAVNFGDLHRGGRFGLEEGAPRFEVLEMHRNAVPTVMRREGEVPGPGSVPQFAGLQARALEKEPGANFPGIRIRVEGRDQELVLWGGVERPEILEMPDGSYRFLELRRKRFELPLFMELRDFQRTTYPGTEKPKDFRSLVTVHVSDEVSRPVVIKMNEPFRLNGWTFYQQKFDMGADKELSVLQVTRNFGRVIPYWATGITSLGLAMHFLQVQWMQLRRRRRTA